MPAGKDVRPHKWSDVIDLYDDGKYAAIWGYYDGESSRCLGVRWNGDDSHVGYPNQGANPLWFIEPDFTTKNILLTLLDMVNKDASIGKIENILLALKEFG